MLRGCEVLETKEMFTILTISCTEIIVTIGAEFRTYYCDANVQFENLASAPFTIVMLNIHFRISRFKTSKSGKHTSSASTGTSM